MSIIYSGAAGVSFGICAVSICIFMELVFVQCCVVPRSRVLGCIATRSRGAASSCAAAGSSARAHARTHAHTRSNGYRLMVTGKLRLLNNVQGSKMNE
jgi:hypothetical protein